jgi:hypothetical protein
MASQSPCGLKKNLPRDDCKDKFIGYKIILSTCGNFAVFRGTGADLTAVWRVSVGSGGMPLSGPRRFDARILPSTRPPDLKILPVEAEN